MPHETSHRSFRYALFDFDGVVFDSEPLFPRATVEYIADIGATIPSGFLDTLYGRRTTDVIHDLARLTGKPYREVLDSRQHILERLAREELVPLTGLRETLDRLQETGIRCAIVSGSTRRFIGVLLSHFGLDGSFECIIAGEDVPVGKPSPDGYLRALALLGANAADAVAIEDSPPGIRAARAAGVFVYGVRNGRPFDIVAEADFVVPDVRGILAGLLRSHG